MRKGCNRRVREGARMSTTGLQSARFGSPSYRNNFEAGSFVNTSGLLAF